MFKRRPFIGTHAPWRSTQALLKVINSNGWMIEMRALQ
jgi:hypothetical protein